jgi:pimeloyl-ACP methyl ester carboxylesterase
VLFLHGFPTFWWLWRDILGPVSSAGFQAAALDLRGYGASDHPPRGYDPRTLAADVAGVVRAMGHDRAVVVGHGVGGLVAWTAATLQAESVRAVCAVSAAHPNALRSAMLTDPRQVRALSYVLAYQRPWLAERALLRNGAAAVTDLLTRWAQPEQLPDAVLETYRAAFLHGNTAHCAIEFHRWALRSIPRPDGRSFAVAMQNGVTVPVMHIHGATDVSILLQTAQASREFALGSWTMHTLECGHLIPEQRPDELASRIVSWLKDVVGD